MAEIQTTTDSGEMAQRFVEFVMMQAQNAALFLGQIPNPQSDKPEINLDLAKMFIDQLVMIRQKTQGNLSKDETTVLNNTLSNLQMVFFEVSQQQKGGSGVAQQTPQKSSEPATPKEPSSVSSPSPSNDTESKKKFTKSYGS